jgi:putative DNA primase/helicase
MSSLSPYENTEDAARVLLNKGISSIPIKIDGSKAPALPSWKAYQSRLPTGDEVAGWFGPIRGSALRPSRGIALVCGGVSGNLEALDVDDFGVAVPLLVEIERRKKGLAQRLVKVRTPRPGLLLLYRCAEIEGNQVLARALAEPGTVGKARIETRGEGGYVLGVSSPARCHPRNEIYKFTRANSTYSEIQEISVAERQILFDCARLFDRQVKIGGAVGASNPVARLIGSPLLPGDDFNLRADVRDLLIQHGWQPVGNGSKGELWRRPEKESGWSGQLFPNGLFHVFSSSTGLKQTTYTPFALFAALECGNDFRKATRELALKGYGMKR